MQQARPRPAGSNWITFHPDSVPKGYDLIHQFTAGKTKAVIYADPADFDSVRERFSTLMPSDAKIDLHAKSIGVYIPVEPIDPFHKTFSEQGDVVQIALDKIWLLKGMIEKSL